jgi:hypothetical protein
MFIYIYNPTKLLACVLMPSQPLGSPYLWKTTDILVISVFIMCINRSMECKNCKYSIQLQYL